MIDAWRARLPPLVTVPALLVVVLASAAPLVVLVMAAADGGGDPVVGVDRLGIAILRQLLVVLVTVPLELAVGTMLALLLPHRGPLLPVVCAALLLPLLAPPVVIAVVGGRLVDFLGPIAGFLLTELWHWGGLVTVPGVLALRAVPGRVRDAALVDGLPLAAWCRHIAWPRLAPVVLVAAAVRIAGCLAATAEPLGIWRDHPDLALGTPGVTLGMIGGVTGSRALLALLLTLLAVTVAAALLSRIPDRWVAR